MNRAAATYSSYLLLVLVLAVLTSAFTLIYLKDLNRRLFIQYQNLQQIGQQHEINWSKLLLEQSTLSTQARIEQIAQKKLAMELPTNKSVVIVSE